MIIRICYFTKKGQELAERLLKVRPDLLAEIRNKEENLEHWVEESFARRLPVLFIGATGIAVRSIAPFVKDKLVDSAVIVMDEKGQFVIPLLSGHMGGANELAVELADLLGATPVLTTATDVEGLFSVDVFARKNHLHVVNRDGIRQVSAKLLRGETIKIWIAEDIVVRDTAYPEGVEILTGDSLQPDVIIRRGKAWQRTVYGKKEGQEVEQEVNCGQRKTKECAQVEDSVKHQCLILETREYVIGMGCKKDKPYADLMAFLQKQGIRELESRLYALASIDLKKSERGLQGVAQYFHLPFLTFPATELEHTEGDFTTSDFVKQTTGVSNVCERAAVCAGGSGTELVVRKTAEDGMTFALARKQPEIVTWET